MSTRTAALAGALAALVIAAMPPMAAAQSDGIVKTRSNGGSTSGPTNPAVPQHQLGDPSNGTSSAAGTSRPQENSRAADQARCQRMTDANDRNRCLAQLPGSTNQRPVQ